MKTQRELLELAAKAAGIDGWWESAYLSFILRSGGPWRPLDDDGDALRLAVKLGVNLVISPEAAISDARVPLTGGCWCTEPHIGSDPLAATRLAIVRAAAAIGEAMP